MWSLLIIASSTSCPFWQPRWMRAGGMDATQTSRGIAALGSGSPAQFGGWGTRGSPVPGHTCRKDFGNGISPGNHCYFPAGVICGEPVSVVNGASPHRGESTRGSWWMFGFAVAHLSCEIKIMLCKQHLSAKDLEVLCKYKWGGVF